MTVARVVWRLGVDLTLYILTAPVLAETIYRRTWGLDVPAWMLIVDALVIFWVLWRGVELSRL